MGGMLVLSCGDLVEHMLECKVVGLQFFSNIFEGFALYAETNNKLGVE